MNLRRLPNKDKPQRSDLYPLQRLWAVKLLSQLGGIRLRHAMYFDDFEYGDVLSSVFLPFVSEVRCLVRMSGHPKAKRRLALKKLWLILTCWCPPSRSKVGFKSGIGGRSANFAPSTLATIRNRAG
ncbi:hypothetical protein AGR8A_pAt20006 [Agrobacterium fabrum str. J-07]|nr:hypothetical protein AGR8A_pAt20006 [Agrobacterium fabrum str. J-07]